MDLMDRIQTGFQALLDVSSTDREGARGRRLLNLLLLGMSAATLLMLLAVLIAAAAGEGSDPLEVRELAFGIVITLFGIAGIAILRRRQAVQLSGSVLLLILAIIALSGLPIQVAGGQSLTLLAIPILLATLFLHPWASFILAALSCLMILVIGVIVEPLSNLPAVAAFFVLIVVSWLSTRSLEQALDNARSANRELHASEARYRALFDGVPVGLYRVSPTGRFLDVNLALVEMLGFPARESVLAIDARRLYVHAEDYARWGEVLERNGAAHSWEGQWLRNDGTVIDVRCRARAWRTADGRVAYYEGSVEDVTERRRSEQLIRALNEAALAVESVWTPQEIFAVAGEQFGRLGMECMVLLADEGHEVLTLDYLSYHPERLKRVERQLGMQLRGLQAAASSVRAYSEAIRQQKATFDGDAVSLMEQLLPKHMGRSARHVVRMMQMERCICAPLMTEDKVIGLLSVHSPDLTEADTPGIAAFAHQMAAAWHKAKLMEELRTSLRELTDAQERLLQSQKLESIGRLAGGIAHDFSNLLTVMLGHAQLALDRPGLSSTLHAHLSEIQTAARRAAKMTGQLLAFSRREILQKRLLDLNELISEYSEMLARTIGEHIELQLDLAPQLKRTLADGDALGRVLMNLVLNARDAMPEGGTLRIATAQVTVDDDRSHSRAEATPGDYVRLTVSDSGVGMDKSTQEHLFEPFFTTKEPGSGTGLGMAMAYGILKQHQGWLEVHSAAGEGTTVDVYIPVHAGTVEEAAEQAMAMVLPSGNETILLAEDEPAVQRFARGVLEGLGYSVLVASDGEEAVELFVANADRMQLLILDAVMPRMSGSNAYAAMRGLREDVPVLFITGYSEEMARLVSQMGNSVNILRKPFGPADLAYRVREVLDAAKGETVANDETLDTATWQA